MCLQATRLVVLGFAARNGNCVWVRLHGRGDKRECLLKKRVHTRKYVCLTKKAVYTGTCVCTDEKTVYTHACMCV